MALLGPQTGAAKKAVFIATRKTKLNYHHNKKDQQQNHRVQPISQPDEHQALLSFLLELALCNSNLFKDF